MKALGMTFGKSQNQSHFNFFAPGNRYNITRFQRAYTWDKYQIKGIIDDLEYISETGEQVGWPSILIQESLEKHQNPNCVSYDIGDGQQRVISVSLGLIALWQRAHTLKSMSEITSEDFEYFRGILPEVGVKDSTEGILNRLTATNRGFVNEPTINFFSKTANESFKALLSPLTEDVWIKIDKSTDGSESINNIFNAFKIYYENFSELSFNELKNYSEYLLNKISLSVLIYNPNENMQRAFANMNSFGVALTEPELVKAEFYGYIKTIDLNLAEEIAEYWTNNFETEGWKKSNPHDEFEPRSKFAQKPPLENFLEEFYYLKSDWDSIVDQRVREGSSNHWLRDSWGKYLRNETNLRKLWEDLKTSSTVFKTARSKMAMTPGSLDWDINYSFNTLGRGQNFLSILMKMKLSMSDEDLKKSLNIMMRYLMYLQFTGGDSRNFTKSLILSGSVLFENKISYEDIKKQLEGTTGHRRQWRSKDFIIKDLTNRKFNNLNTELCELFIFIINEEKREKNEISGLFNTRTKYEGRVKSLEHILPQKSREDLSPEEEISYAAYTSRLGNFLVLSGDLNSSANNRSVKDKLPFYEEAKLNPWGFYWTESFLKEYSKKSQWGENEIKNRSKELAKIIGNKISPENPYSEFRPLLKDNNEGDIFIIEENEDEDNLMLMSDGTFMLDSGDFAGGVKDITQNIPSLNNKKKITLIKVDKDLNSLKKYQASNSEVIELEIKDPSIARSKVLVQVKDFKKESLSMKEIYVEFLKHFYKTHPEEIIEQLYSMNGIIEKEKIDSDRLKFYKPLNDVYYIYANKSRDSLKNSIIKTSNGIGIGDPIIEHLSKTKLKTIFD